MGLISLRHSWSYIPLNGVIPKIVERTASDGLENNRKERFHTVCVVVNDYSICRSGHILVDKADCRVSDTESNGGKDEVNTHLIHARYRMCMKAFSACSYYIRFLI